MKRLPALLVLILCFALTACVYVQHSHTGRHGTEVSKEQVALIEPGKTDKDWILKNLGTPDRVQAERDGLEIYEYVSERTEHSKQRFIVLFSVESNKVVSRKVTRVVMRNGIVESIKTVDA